MKGMQIVQLRMVTSMTVLTKMLTTTGFLPTLRVMKLMMMMTTTVKKCNWYDDNDDDIIVNGCYVHAMITLFGMLILILNSDENNSIYKATVLSFEM